MLSNRSHTWAIMAAQIARVLEGVLRQPDQTDQEAIRVGTPAWWRWLDAETTRSFAFHGPSGHFTARKARRRAVVKLAQAVAAIT